MLSGVHWVWGLKHHLHWLTSCRGRLNPRPHPGSLIKPAALSARADIPDELLPPPLCPFFSFSITAGEGTAARIHCDTNFTPTQGHSEGVMEKRRRMSETNKRQRRNMVPWPREQNVAPSASTASRVQLGSQQEGERLDTPGKTLWNNRDTNE